MHSKLAALFAGIALALSAGLFAQSNGFPSRPVFQSVNVGGGTKTTGNINTNGSTVATRSVLVTNTNTGTTANSQFAAFNSSGRGIRMNMTGVNYSGSAITGGPVGEAGLLFTDNAQPLAIGTNATARVIVASNGVVSFPGNTCSTGGTCDVSSMAIGSWVSAIKEANTNRISSTTLTVDDDLIYSNVPAGYYRLRGFLNIDNAGAAGFTMQMQTSVAFGTESLGTGILSCNGTVNAQGFQYSGATAVTVGTCAATSDDGAVTFELNFDVGSTATVALYWAQQTSVAANTTLRRGSYLELTRLN